MTKEKCKEVLDFYRKNLGEFYFKTTEEDLPAAEKAPENEEMELGNEMDYFGNEIDRFNFETEKVLVAHLLYMFDEMEKMLVEDKMEKFFRWLGFVQGVCWTLGYQSLEDLKNLNRAQESNPTETVEADDKPRFRQLALGHPY